MILSRLKLLFASLAAMAVIAPASLMAQVAEINPYVGWYWPSTSSAGHLKDSDTFGIRAGYFLDANTEIEGTFGYMNHFQIKDTDVRTRGLLWQVGASYNFSTEEFPFTHKFAPFFIADVGGITLRSDGYSYPIAGNIQLAGGGSLNTVRTISVNDGDTFFNVSYGVGLKSVKLWGPMGFRAEVRGRTIPNYYHGSPTLLEATLGLNFVFGARKPY
jgi:hypothetical protein